MRDPSSAVHCCLLFAALRGVSPGSLAWGDLAQERTEYWSAGRDQGWANAWMMALTA